MSLPARFCMLPYERACPLVIHPTILSNVPACPDYLPCNVCSYVALDSHMHPEAHHSAAVGQCCARSCFFYLASTHHNPCLAFHASKASFIQEQGTYI